MFQDKTRLLKEDSARASDPDAARISIKQFDAYFRFQIHDLRAECGLRDAQAQGRLAVVQLLRNRYEVSQMAQFHVKRH